NGTSFQSVVASMEGPGPEPPPFRAEKVGNATLIVGVAGTPPKKDVVVPCVAESSTSHPLEALSEIVATRRLGEAWGGLRRAAPQDSDVAQWHRRGLTHPAPEPSGAVAPPRRAT